MTEAHGSEVEKVLLFISDAQQRAAQASERIEKDAADSATVQALREAEAGLGELHRRLMQATYYAVSDSVQQLAV